MEAILGLAIIFGIIWLVWRTMYRKNHPDSIGPIGWIIVAWRSHWVVKGLMVLFGFSFLQAAFQDKSTTAPPPPAQSAPAPVSDKFKSMSPAEHLAAAQKSASTNNWGATKLHLDAVPKTAPESGQAQKLAAELPERQKKYEAQAKQTSDERKFREMERTADEVKNKMRKYYANAEDVSKLNQNYQLAGLAKHAYSTRKNEFEKKLYARAAAALAKTEVVLREAYASSIEEILVRNGMDVRVRAAGKTLRVKYALMSQPMVYRFQNEAKIDDQAKAAGFTRVVYTNGFESSLGSTWTVSLNDKK